MNYLVVAACVCYLPACTKRTNVQFLKKLDSSSGQADGGAGGAGVGGSAAGRGHHPGSSLQGVLTKTLGELSKLDKHNIFAAPVPADTPNYYTMIKRPMDLSTMRRSLGERGYATLRAMQDDFELMLRNCMTYNQPETIFYKEAQRLLRDGTKKIGKAAAKLSAERCDRTR